jgi:hypothetical protein
VMVPSSSLQYLAIAQYLQYQYQRWCRQFSCAQGYCRCSGAVSWTRGRCYGYADCFKAIYRAPSKLATLSRAANIDLGRIYCPGEIFACLFASEPDRTAAPSRATTPGGTSQATVPIDVYPRAPVRVFPRVVVASASQRCRRSMSSPAPTTTRRNKTARRERL